MSFVCDYKNYIYDYLLSGKEFDEKSLKYLIEMIASSEYLSDYLKNIQFGSLKSCAIYFPSYRNLIIDLRNIKFGSFNLLPSFSSNLNRMELIRFFNFNCLCTILHELEHVKQKKDSIERTYADSVIQNLIDEGIEFGSRLPNDISWREKILYSIFYNQVLFERDAEIKSLFTFIDLGLELSFLSINDLSFYNNNLLKMCLSNYKKSTNGIISPSEFYYHKRGKFNEFLLLKFESNKDNVETISWGLPIDLASYEKLKEFRKESSSIKNVKKKILTM